MKNELNYRSPPSSHGAGVVFGLFIGALKHHQETMTRSFSSGLIALLLSALCSCATATVWEAADPNAEIVIRFADISEETLKARGIHYYKSEKMGCYFVEKSASQKLRDYTIRCFAAPVTITLDTATIGVVAFAFIKGGTPANPNTSASDTTWPEWINHLHY